MEEPQFSHSKAGTKCSYTKHKTVIHSSVFYKEERIYTQNRLPLFIDFASTAAAAELRHRLGDLMPAQKRPRDSSSPPPSPSPPPDAEGGDDSQEGSENHDEEQPESASGALLDCASVLTSMGMHYVGYAEFELLFGIYAPDSIVVCCLADLSLPRDRFTRFRKQLHLHLQRRRERRVMFLHLFVCVVFIHVRTQNHVWTPMHPCLRVALRFCGV